MLLASAFIVLYSLFIVILKYTLSTYTKKAVKHYAVPHLVFTASLDGIIFSCA